MADAMNYEYLLRRIYQVGRYGQKDANADIYRHFEHDASLYILEKENIAKRLPRIDTRSIEKLEAEYKTGCRKIWQIVQKALVTGYDKYGHRFTDDEKHEFKGLLLESVELTKDHIDKVIDKAETIFVNHKIYPG